MFHFLKPSDPLRLTLPRSWPLFPLSPAMVYPSQALSETAREAGPGSAAWPSASGTSASKPMGGLALGAKPLTEDSFLQTGSFDSFSEPAVLLVCGRGHSIPQCLILGCSESLVRFFFRFAPLASECCDPTGMYSAARPCFTRHQLHHIAPLPAPTCVALPLRGLPGVPVAPAPSPSMLSPGAWLHDHRDFRAIACARILRLPVHTGASHAACRPLYAVRKENCLPLKMLLVRTWRRALRRRRASPWPPGPPAAAQNRGECLLPAGRLQPCPALSPGSREGRGPGGEGCCSCPQLVSDCLAWCCSPVLHGSQVTELRT